MKDTSHAYKISASITPFMSPGLEKESDVEPVRQDIEKSIQRSFQPLIDWVFKGHFTYDGLTYRKGVNDFSAMAVLKSIYPVESLNI